MKKIIYIDDDELNTQLFKMNFRNKYEVYTTLNPLNGISMIKNENIKVIITDYKMPEMNGMELINEVKKFQPESVCMVLSAYLESEVITEKHKIFKYMMKPYKREELNKNIEEAFNLLQNAD
ncbi:MAG: response regulator [Bacteroidales bacterium]|nr:response regulator [Bacteroidales bacterium]